MCACSEHREAASIQDQAAAAQVHCAICGETNLCVRTVTDPVGGNTARKRRELLVNRQLTEKNVSYRTTKSCDSTSKGWRSNHFSLRIQKTCICEQVWHLATATSGL